MHNWTPSSQNFEKKGGGKGSDFSHKNGGVGKIGEAVLKKGGVSLIFILVWK